MKAKYIGMSLSCSDGNFKWQEDALRFHLGTNQLLDRVCVPGGVLGYFECRSYLREQIKRLMGLHQYNLINIGMHRGCGAYPSFTCKAWEWQHHLRKLDLAEELIRQDIPEAEIQQYISDRVGNEFYLFPRGHDECVQINTLDGTVKKINAQEVQLAA
jgi:hypothetical protein